MGLHLQPSVHHNKKEQTGNNAVQEPLSHLPGSHPQLGTLRQPDYQRESFLSPDQLRVSVQQSDVQGRWRSGAGELPHCGQHWGSVVLRGPRLLLLLGPGPLSPSLTLSPPPLWRVLEVRHKPSRRYSEPMEDMTPRLSENPDTAMLQARLTFQD